MNIYNVQTKRVSLADWTPAKSHSMVNSRKSSTNDSIFQSVVKFGVVASMWGVVTLVIVFIR